MKHLYEKQTVAQLRGERVRRGLDRGAKFTKPWLIASLVADDESAVFRRAAAKVTAPARIVCWANPMDYVKDHGFRVAFVTEGEDFFRPTGNWPFTGAPGESMPWFWGPTIEDAQRAADEYNERLGVSKADALKIIGRSMTAGLRRTGGR